MVATFIYGRETAQPQARRNILNGMKKKNPAAVALGRRGGRARAKALTAAQRRAIAVKAIRARWARATKDGA